MGKNPQKFSVSPAQTLGSANQGARQVSYVFSGFSDKGQVRQHNEDAILSHPAAGLAIVADGLGGANAGEVASQMLVSHLGSALLEVMAAAKALPVAEQEGFLREAIATHVQAANQQIYLSALADRAKRGMGSTLVLAMFIGDMVVAAHVGDSRLYRLRNKFLTALTRDHTVSQALIDVGDGNPENVQRNGLLLRAVGVGQQLDVEINSFSSEPGDIYLLCSDGLTDMVSDSSIRAILSNAGELMDMHFPALNLVKLANEQGGRDNISAIVVKRLI